MKASLLKGTIVAWVLFHATTGLAQKVISYVDTSLSDAEKFVLRVDDKPFYMTSIQYRVDKLISYEGWSEQQVRNVFQQLVADNFNTVSIPLHWALVETSRDVFDWKRLDFYLDMIESAGIKYEMLWFGSNTCGGVLSDKHNILRVPAYVMKDYQICQASSDYTLDIADTALMNRETYVLSQVMEHIAQWDEEHGNKHTVIGVQINNEPKGLNGYKFSSMEMMRYLSHVASAVKQSRYITWTRVNATTHEYTDYINANEELRETEGTNIDFVGVDSYGKTPTQLATFIPTKGLNYKMIMECGAEEANSQVFPFAALTTNTAFSYYEYVGPDNHGLYDLTSSRGVVKPHNENTLEVIRAQNRLFNAAMQDVATKASYKSLMVHNGTASDPSTTKGVCGITLDPLSPTQAVSICRSDSELVLLTVQRGDWNIPASLHAKSASKGYFDVNNKWVEEEALSFNGTYLPRVEGSVIRILLDTETDGIHDMSDLRYTPTKNVYNLQGQYSYSPHLPGIYVIHGRKYIKH